MDSEQRRRRNRVGRPYYRYYYPKGKYFTLRYLILCLSFVFLVFLVNHRFPFNPASFRLVLSTPFLYPSASNSLIDVVEGDGASWQIDAVRGSQPPLQNDKSPLSGGNASSRTWGIPSIFRGSSAEKPANSTSSGDPSLHADKIPPTVQLREPSPVLRPLETADNGTVEILVTKTLLQSYYDIVRKNFQDLVPKTIMHFLVNHAKRNLQNTLVQELYRSDRYEELLREEAEVAVKRKHNQDLFRVLQQAIEMLEDVDSDISTRSSYSGLG